VPIPWTLRLKRALFHHVVAPTNVSHIDSALVVEQVNVLRERGGSTTSVSSEIDERLNPQEACKQIPRTDDGIGHLIAGLDSLGAQRYRFQGKAGSPIGGLGVHRTRIDTDETIQATGSRRGSAEHDKREDAKDR
jgi:hypothetical protein